MRHAQTVAVCRAICARIPNRTELWTSDGPTPIAVEWLNKGHPLSSTEGILFDLAWAVWSGSYSKVTLGDLVQGLSGSELVFVGSLLIAIGNGNEWIDSWLTSRASKGVGNG